MSLERFRPKELLKQTDGQTCLPCCLLMAYSAIYPARIIDFKSSEKRLYHDSFGLYPENYTLTHAASFVRRYKDVEIALYVDSPAFARHLFSKNKEDRVGILTQPISLGFITDEIRKSPLIVYTDGYYLKGGNAHVPHFVYLFPEDSGESKMIDPASGEMRNMSDKELEDSILGLKYCMLWSPMVLKVKKISNEM